MRLQPCFRGTVRWSITEWLKRSGGQSVHSAIIAQLGFSRERTITGEAAVAWSQCWAGAHLRLYFCGSASAMWSP